MSAAPQLGRLLSAVTIALLSASAAHAETADVKYDGKHSGQSVKITSSLFNGNVFAGQLQHTITGGSNYDGQWITYCTDLAQSVTSSFKEYTFVSVDQLPSGTPMGAIKASAIRDLFAYAGGSQLLESTSDSFASAFQLAIWEIILDLDANANGLGLNVTAGSFAATKTNGDALSSSVMTHLTSLFGAIGNVDASGIELVGLKSGQYQDQLIVVPAPGALALVLVTGLLGRRRRK